MKAIEDLLEKTLVRIRETKASESRNKVSNILKLGKSEPLPCTLTKREREALPLVAQGHTNVEVANQMSISPNTSEVHRVRMIRKFALEAHTQVINDAMKQGTLPTNQ